MSERIYGKGQKKWVSYFHRTAQPHTLASFPTWGIQQELVVKDLPAAKLRIIFSLGLILQILSTTRGMIRKTVDKELLRLMTF
jgi:hypothetical protein